MPANNNPIHPDTPHVETGQLTTANTLFDGTGAIVDVFTAGADGSKVYSVKVTAIETTSSGLINLWVHDGSAYRLFDSAPVEVAAPGAGTAPWEFTWALNMALPSTHKLAVSTFKGEKFDVLAIGGDY